MKTRLHYIIEILATIGLLAYTTPAEASYYANCQLTVSLQQIHKANNPKAKVKMTFRITAIGKQGGHSKRHCSNKKMKGKTYTTFVYIGTQKQALLHKLKKGTILQMRYSYSDSMTPNGVVSGEGFWLKSCIAKKARPKKCKTKKNCLTGQLCIKGRCLGCILVK